MRPPKQSFESWDGTSQSNLGALENHSVAKGRIKKEKNQRGKRDEPKRKDVGAFELPAQSHKLHEAEGGFFFFFHLLQSIRTLFRLSNFWAQYAHQLPGVQ